MRFFGANIFHWDTSLLMISRTDKRPYSLATFLICEIRSGEEMGKLTVLRQLVTSESSLKIRTMKDFGNLGGSGLTV